MGNWWWQAGHKAGSAALAVLMLTTALTVPVGATESDPPATTTVPEPDKSAQPDGDATSASDLPLSDDGADIVDDYVPGEAVTDLAKAILDTDPDLARNPFGLLVRFAPDADSTAVAEALAAIGGQMVGEPLDGQSLHLVETLHDLDAASDHLQGLEGVEWVGFDEVVHATDIPTDPRLDELWGLIGDNGIDAPGAWAHTLGSPSVVVAVIDTGIDLDHPDLAANIWTNPGEIAGNGVDDDGNGYIDDMHGWDFVNDDADPDDDNNHGTHVAGTIAAVDDTVGVVGVAPDVQVMALKFLSAGGSGYISDAVSSLSYAIDNGALISNNSWGGGGFSSAMSSVLDQAAAIDHLFVAAAGNSSNDNDASPSYPSSYTHDNVLAVASSQSDGSKSGFSSYGATSVDVVAPGSGILSTVVGGGYASFNGTSMATPHVAGAAALLRSVDPTISATAIKQLLIDTARYDSRLDGYAVSDGVIDAADAVAAIAVPGPDITVTASEDSVTEGDTVVVTAVASDLDGNDVSAQVVWTIGGTQMGTGSSYTHTTTTSGTLRIIGSVTVAGVTAADAVTISVAEIVRTVTVDAPNGGETFDPGDPVTISWSSVGPVGPVDVSVVERSTTQVESTTGLPIDDYQTLSVPIDVSGVGTVDSVEVGVRLNHTYTGDLKIDLVAPDGTSVTLSSYAGSWGNNYGTGAADCSGNLTVFADDADQSISNGSAPFDGRYTPVDALSGLAGGTADGQWELRVTDSAGWDTGDLYCVVLDLGGATTLVADDVDVAAGSVVWTVPTSMIGRDLVALVGNSHAEDRSDAPFSITTPPPTTTTTTTTIPPTVELLTPNGGESYVTGDEVVVSWTTTGAVGPLDIVAVPAVVAPEEFAGPDGLPIHDFSTLVAGIEIPDGGDIADLQVGLRIQHTYTGDLEILLRHPDGTAVTLVENEGGWRNNFGSGSADCAGTMTVFADDAAHSIEDGQAPFTGRFRPEDDLGDLVGRPMAGSWQIEITDEMALDQGMLHCVELRITGSGFSIATDVTASPVTWTIDESVVSGDYLVTVDDGSVSDASDGVFTVTTATPPSTTTTTTTTTSTTLPPSTTTTVPPAEPEVLVVAPNGGESFAIGEAIDVSWSTQGDPGTVDVSAIRIVDEQLEDIAGQPILDNQVLEVDLPVSATGTIQDLSVGLRLDHTYAGDLVIELVAPDGTSAKLADRHGGWRNNFGSGAADCSANLTVLSDNAERSIGEGRAPFAGSFRPDQDLSVFDGVDAAGIWTLRIADEWSLDQGTLHCVTLRADGERILIAEDVAADASPVTWTPTADLVAGDFEIEVAAAAAIDRSDAPFHVDGAAPPSTTTTTTTSTTTTTTSTTTTTTPPVDPEIEVVAPNGGEAFDIGDDIAIDWTAAGDVGLLDIGVRRKAGATVEHHEGLPIQDYQTTIIDLPVIGDGTVDDVVLGLRLDHTYTADLEITLVHPDGTRVTMAFHNGSWRNDFGTGAADCTGDLTWFTDAADVSIRDGQAPFAGEYRPYNPMSVFDARDAAGMWRLEIHDHWYYDQGAVHCADLQVTSDLIPVASDVDPAQGSVVWSTPTDLVAGDFEAVVAGVVADRSDASFRVGVQEPPPPADYSVTSGYENDEYETLVHNAGFLGMTVEDMQWFGVQVLAGFADSSPEPVAPIRPRPDVGGPNAVTTIWQPADHELLVATAALYDVTPAELQKAGALLLSVFASMDLGV